ncbi:MAG: agmatine deiminase family protein [Sandaracinaceae bacterium]|nr:agmatine deiminase family protein [Sandaracinaceae bacterium]
MSVLVVSGCAGLGATIDVAKPEPPEWTFALPGEFEPVDRVLIGWEEGNWDYLPYFTELADEVSHHAPVLIVGADADREAFADHLTQVGVPAAAIEQLDAPLDSMWMRDYGPVFVRSPDGSLVVVDLPYHDDRLNDDAVPTRVAEAQHRPELTSKLPMEGGHIQADGRGRCVLTTDVLVSAEAYLDMDERALGEELYSLFGCEETTYVSALQDEETGHLDVFALITAPGRILVGQYDRLQDPHNAAILDEDAEILRAAGFTVTRIPMPPNGHRRIFRTYTNALILNDAVLVPVFHHQPGQERIALRILAGQFPGRAIIPIDSGAVMALAGAVHCTTRAIPSE